MTEKREIQSVAELYDKLRPYLRVYALRYAADWERVKRRTGRTPWRRPGSFTFCAIRWAPGDAQGPPYNWLDRPYNWLDRPTYEEFCLWYELDPRKGLL